MSQPDKRTSKQPKAQPTDKALPEAQLEKVSGGKTQLSDIPITHTYDKASPKLT